MTAIPHTRILIISDIEGSSGCKDYESTRFMGQGWPEACVEMTRDVDNVAKALFNAGVQKIFIKDFHRTGYNLYRSGIDHRAELISGYRIGPVPGIGSVYDTTGLIMLGMHAPSGADGFLPHTLTSRIRKLEVNGELMSEAQLFSASLSPFNLAPLFFSGCPVACDHASETIKNIHCFPIRKTDRLNAKNRTAWRNRLGPHAVTALLESKRLAYTPEGPFHAVVTLDKPEKVIEKVAGNWGYRAEKGRIHIHAPDIHILYQKLIQLAYFTPLTLKLLPFVLPLYNLMGKTGLAWSKRRLKAAR